MPVVRKATLVGIDKAINELQTVLFNALIVAWDLDPAMYNCYPRCYRNQQSANGYVAELYIGDKEYKEAYYNDKVSATSFFGISTSERISEGDNIMTAEVHLVFMINLSECRPGADRNDEQARLDVQTILDKQGAVRGWFVKRQILGIEKCLAEYPGSRQSEGLRFRADTHPAHIFRFDIEISYQPTQISC